jgi:hypothetical protein
MHPHQNSKRTGSRNPIDQPSKAWATRHQLPVSTWVPTRSSYIKQNFCVMVSLCVPALREPFNAPMPIFLLLFNVLLKAAK